MTLALPSIYKLFPFVRWMKNTSRESARADLIAGLTGAVIVLPQGVAFATIAGMPPEYGLYASMIPAIIAALFGSSWHLVSGPTTAASVVMYSSLSAIAVPGSAEYISLAITLAFMVGMLQIILGLAKLGTLVNFISHSVVIGFTTGAAFLIAGKQAKAFLGLEMPDTGHLLETISYLWDHWSAFHPLVTLVSVSTLVSGILFRKYVPKFPGMIGALMVGAVLANALNLLLGADSTGIRMIGALPGNLPPLSRPVFSMDMLKELLPLCLAMTLLALTEAVSIARSIAVKSGQAIEPSQEFVGQGLSNIVGSFFSSYVATGSFNRSGANYDAGARSPMAAVSAALILMVMLPFVAPLTAWLPIPAVAGLLFLIAWRLINFSQIRKVIRADEKEAVVMLITFLSTIVLRLEDAIIIGVILSLLFYLRKTSKPKMLSRVPDQLSEHRKFTTSYGRDECPQLKILRLDDSLYFGSVTHVGELFRLYREKYPEQKHMLLLTKGINQIDVAGAELLQLEALERRKMGGEFYMYRIKDSATRVLKRGGYLDVIDKGTIYDSKEEAIEEIFKRLDKDICRTCTKRIFKECQTI